MITILAPRSPAPRASLPGLLAWIMIIAGTLGLPFSVLFLLNIAGKSYATQEVNVLLCGIMLPGPAALLLTGLGLRKRRFWARSVTAAGISAILLACALQCVTEARPGPAWHRGGMMAASSSTTGIRPGTAIIMGACALLMIRLLTPEPARTRAFAMPAEPSSTAQPVQPWLDESRRPWRVGHQGRDLMYYEEEINDHWMRLDIDGEMLTGRAHHVIYFASEDRWQSYPEWARHRRAQIIARIKREFRQPDYEYEGDA